jgi:signal transduction histidine kinase
MTATATLQVKTIASLLEAIDADDVKDAETAVKLIRAILDATEKKS